MRFNRFNLLLVATAIITSMSGCTGSQKRTTQQEKESATMATTTVNTKNKNFYGTYEGTLPCADCSGIRTTLKINSDTTYELRSEYLGRKDGVFEESGIYNIVGENIYGAQNETYIEGWEKSTSNLLIYKRLCKI